MSYTIDIKRSAMAPEPHLGRFALYVSFFPQLVAGPIERAARLIPQLRERKDFDYERVSSGLQLMAWGLFKKVVVGDRLGIYVDAVYNNAGDHSGLTFWIATYAFAFQIYCDFSGYSDMAIGAARVLGYDLMRNFDRPYFSRTITEFWRRWHISLSTWLRDYLYISLGGNRGGVWNTYRNLMITMVLGGLWHGASWNFITWGTLQGVFLMFSRITLPARDAFWAAVRAPKTLVTLLRVFVTFHLVCFSWVFFRAATFGDALAILKGGLTGFGMPFIHVQSMAHGFVGVVILLCVQLVQERYGSVRKLISGLPTPVRWALWYGLILATITLGIESGAQFIYFQF
jgi:D-alanyl-lipoteichoic acid acyltransferase DltB (MBOAT superfamily)